MVVGIDLTRLFQDKGKWRAHLNMAMNHHIPYTARNILTSWETISFSSITLPHGVIYYVIHNKRIAWVKCIYDAYLLKDKFSRKNIVYNVKCYYRIKKKKTFWK